MPPKPLIDLDLVDVDKTVDGPEGIRKYNPQRYEFEQLNAIVFYDEEQGIVVGRKDVEDDEFWVRGHIPERPLFPGVLMCECAAQLCSYYFKRVTQTDKFLGFGGMDRVKFRGQVQPGDTLVVVANNVKIARRMAIFECQGFVDQKMVFQGKITGMPM